MFKLKWYDYVGLSLIITFAWLQAVQLLGVAVMADYIHIVNYNAVGEGFIEAILALCVLPYGFRVLQLVYILNSLPSDEELKQGVNNGNKKLKRRSTRSIAL